MIKNIFHD